jgi:hypothetical protein
MNVIRTTGWLGAVVLLLGLGSAANAQWGGGGYGGFGGFGYGYGGAYAMNPPPYFAVFPPVYYSYPVSQPYGLSTFANRGGGCNLSSMVVSTGGYRRYGRAAAAPQPARVARSKPVIIENPFVLPEDQRPTRLTDGRPVPQVIDMRAFANADAPARNVLARANSRD